MESAKDTLIENLQETIRKLEVEIKYLEAKADTGGLLESLADEIESLVPIPKMDSRQFELVREARLYS